MMAASISPPARSSTRSPGLGFSSPLPPEAPKESAVARFFIAPLTFVSFLVSLAIIDARNHQLRTNEHSSQRLAPVGIHQHVKYYLHLMVFKPVPSSPYDYLKSPNSVQDLGSKGVVKEKAQEKEPWHWHTKQRHMMKTEMEEAFKVRKWVVVLLFTTGGVSVLAVGMLWRWVGYLLGFGGA